MEVIGYTRVSTDKQAEHGMGLQIQRQAIAAWAKANKARVVAWHSDKGASGAKGFDPTANGLTTRPGLAAAFTALEAGEANALVVYRLDRLARKQHYQALWIERMESRGRQVISVTEPGYGDDEMRVLVRTILGGVAEYERVVIVKRMQSGRAAKAARGGFAYGSPAFGWRAGKDSEGKSALVRDEAEQATLARARQLRADGASIRVIAATLTAEGHPAPRGGRWHPTTIQRLVSPAAREADRRTSARRRQREQRIPVPR